MKSKNEKNKCNSISKNNIIRPTKIKEERHEKRRGGKFSPEISQKGQSIKEIGSKSIIDYEGGKK